MSKLKLFFILGLTAVLLITLIIMPACKVEEAAKEEVAEEGAGEAELTKDELYEQLYGDISGSDVNFMGWQGYEGGDDIQPFLDKYDINLNTAFMASNDEVFAKLKIGGGDILDVSTPSYLFYDSFIENDLLEPLDLSLIPNYKDLYKGFTDDFEYAKADGNVYGIPLAFGTIALLYNADEIPEPPTTWDILLDPQYKGKIIAQDDPLGMILFAAVWLGFERPDQLTKDQLAQCEEKLLEVVGNMRYVATTWGDVQDALVSGEALMCAPGWDAVSLWAQDQGANIQLAIPDEGGYGFIDCWSISKGAANRMAAYAYVNEMLSPEQQALLSNAVSSGVVNSKAPQFMDERLATAYPYDNMAEYFEKVVFFPPVPTESEEYATLDDVVEVWERVKATAAQ